MTKQENNILQYPKKKQLNIGIVIFGIIFIYLIATIVLYLLAPHITVYEVRQGSILKDNAYTGLVIREESVVYSDESGYINYFAENGSKVRVGTRIYTLSDRKLQYDDISSDKELVLTTEEARSILLRIQSYNDQFQEADYGTTYQLKNDIQSSLNTLANQGKSDQLNTMLTEGNLDLSVKTVAQDGIIVYTIDGMESLTMETVSENQLNKSSYEKKELSNNRRIEAGQPVYKLVTDDAWEILIKISEDTRNTLLTKNTVKVNFKKDNEQMRAQLSLFEQNGAYIAKLSFENSMIRYINDRYLDIELILEDESGLKIPKSAETSKQFYIAPKSYLTQGGNSSSDGVMRQTTDSKGKTITEFMQVTVYYEENEMIYLDPNVFHDNDVLLKPDSTETYLLKDKRSLKGVFSINKGYAVFKQIQILCESDEYYIIEEGNSFGLSNYDHIALDGQSLKENDVVF